VRVDPFDPAFQKDPFPVFAQLRSTEPVHFVAEQGWYMVTSLELVREALKHPELYVNSDVAAVRRTEPPAELADEIAAIRADGFPYAPALSLNDPPIHTRYRKLISRAFTPRALAYMEAVVESVAAELVTGLTDGATVDIVDVLARPLPVYAIVRILGLPDARRADIARWSDAASASLGRRLTNEEWLASERDNVDFQLAMAAELDERRARPREDLLSVLVAPPAPGEEALTNGELVFLIRELLVAGNETTTRSIAEAVVQLDRHGQLWSDIRADGAKADTVAEEAIRLASPVLGMFRRVSADTVLGDTPLPAGAIVYLGYGAASRDPDLFTDPDEFSPGREHARDHLAFGFGIHVCVGAQLARMETAVAVRALARAVSRLEVVRPDELSYVPSFFLHGLLSVPVRVSRLVPSATTGV
jgi:cytochrome P450